MPMAPEPTTISFSGTSSITMASRYWMTLSPSMAVPGRLRARAPTAMMKLSAVTLRSAASGDKSTRRRHARVGVDERSVAFDDVDLVLLHQEADALGLAVDDVTAALDRSPEVDLQVVEADAVGAWRRGSVSRTSALWINALVGMQPQFRQTPPRFSRSTMAVFSPNCAARMAAT